MHIYIYTPVYIYIYIHIYVHIYVYIYILVCVKIRVWIGPRWYRRMDRSGSPAFWYGSGVWIGLWVQGMDRGFTFWLEAIYIYIYVYTQYTYTYIIVYLFKNIQIYTDMYTWHTLHRCFGLNWRPPKAAPVVERSEETETSFVVPMDKKSKLNWQFLVII